MADFIPVEQTDTFDQWRIKTNQLGIDFAGLEANVDESISNIDLSSKADTNHSHVIANVTNLENELNSLGAAISTNTASINNCVTFTGGTGGHPEAITGKKAFLTEVDFYDGIRVVGNAEYPNSGIEILGTEPNNRLLIESGKVRLRNNDYTWPASYTGGRYLRTDAQGNLSWEEVAGGSGSVNLSTLVFNDIVPVGTIMPWAGTSLPADGKWKFCNGENVSQITYEELFGLIGNKYGTANDPNSDFRLPNLNGKVPVGAGGIFSVGADGGSAEESFSGSGAVSGGSISISGSTGGTTLTGDQTGVKTHSHGLTFNGAETTGASISRKGGKNNNTQNQPTNPGFGDQFIIGSDQGVGAESWLGVSNNRGTQPVGTTILPSQDADDAHSHDAGTLSGTLSGATANVSGSISTYQPYLVTQYIIKVLPDDVQQVSIDAGNGINVKDQNGSDSSKLDLFSTAINVKVNTNQFKFTASGLLELAENLDLKGNKVVASDMSVDDIDDAGTDKVLVTKEFFEEKLAGAFSLDGGVLTITV